MPVKLSGSTSGFVTLQAPAVAGSNTITMPAETGTAVTTASSNALPVTAIQATGTPSATTALLGSGAWGILQGQLIRAPQIITSGTSYTTPSNCTFIIFELVGAGGGAGGSYGSAGRGGGGGGGAYLQQNSANVSGGTAYSITIGLGGTGGNGGLSGTAGTAGGNTTITISGVTYTAGGGGGGGFGNTASGTPGTAGTSTNGTFNISGVSAGFFGGGGGNGGGLIAPYLVPIGAAVGSSSIGSNATFYGTGGGGGQGGDFKGGNGFQGFIRIWEYT